MPISSSAASLERKKVYRRQISSSIDSTKVPTENKFLTIEPALPSLDHSRSSFKRSNSTVVAPNCNKSNDSTHTTECIALQSYPDGSLHVFRKQEEKERNADRISLDRRGLTTLPVLEDESNLRLLSLQHNLINNLEGFKHQSFSFLVFLDMYDNQLEKIHCLDRLQNLRVLLMGKNRIKKIEGLENLTKVEVLDLHGNQILHINGLSNLNQLKVLNLAGNQIRNVGTNDLKGLISLQEFNLRRNRLKKLLGFGETPSLHKLFLNNNELQAVEDMSSLAKAVNIREIAIDNNPISLGGDCVSFLVSYLPHLTSLNSIQITEQVRKAAMAWRRNKESSNAAFMDLTSDVCLNIRREEVISNARTNWELLRSQTKCLTGNSSNVVNVSRNLKPDSDFILTSLSKPEIRNQNTSRTKPLMISNISSVPMLPDKKLCVRTLSQDTENSQNTSSSNTSSNDFFRLPPILVPILNKLEQKKNDGLKLSESLTSIGPNFDSSVSSIQTNSDSCESSSDSSESSSDDQRDKAQVPIKSKVEIAKTLGNADIIPIGELKVTSPILVVTSDSSSNLSSNIASRSSASESDISNLSSSKKPRCVKSAVSMKITQSKLRNRPLTCKNRKEANPSDQYAEKDREQGEVKKNFVLSAVANIITSTGGDYLIEICGHNLNVYGQGALRFVDKPWSMSKAKEVNTINFNYVNYNSMTFLLSKLKQRFSNLDSFIFKDTNIQYLGQLNALAEVQGLSSLVIDDDGNPITKKNWRSYAIYRLCHWGLKTINGVEVTEDDIQRANQEYQSLSDIVLWSLPNVLLQPLLVRLQLSVGQKITEENAKQWLINADPALRSVVIKESLQWKKGALTQDDMAVRQKAKAFLSGMLDEACNAVHKLRKLDELWPDILKETVRDILLDYAQMDNYMKKQLQELK